MNLIEFERIAEHSVDTLPDEFRSYAQKCMLLFEPRASAALRARMKLGPHEELFGLYEGIPMPYQTHGRAVEVPPRVTLFYEPILAACRTEEAIIRQIQRTVLHEIGHHFGMDEDQLREAGFG